MGERAADGHIDDHDQEKTESGLFCTEDLDVSSASFERQDTGWVAGLVVSIQLVSGSRSILEGTIDFVDASAFERSSDTKGGRVGKRVVYY